MASKVIGNSFSQPLISGDRVEGTLFAKLDDARARARCGDAALAVGEAFALPGLLYPKWLWFRRNEPGLAAATQVVVFAKDYLALRLTGEVATDRTEASTTGLYDLEADAWTSEPPEGAPPLPPIRRSIDVTGRVSAEAARETGIPAGTPVAAGAGDNEAGAIAGGAVVTGRAALTLGTSGTMIGWARSAVPTPGVLIGRHARAGGVAVTGTVLSAGRALEWVRRLAWPDGTPMEEVLAEASASEPSELVFVPSLEGERSPVPDPEASAAFGGLRAHHRRGHLARAVLEGVALSIGQIVRRFDEAGCPVEVVRATGGGAASRFWVAAIAAATDRRLEVCGAARSGPALGAAMLAAAAQGVDDVKSLAAAWIKPETTIEPQAAEVERLARLARVQRALRAARRVDT